MEAVQLLPEVRSTLDELADRTKLSRVDLINRAIVLYGFIDSRTSLGDKLALVRPNDDVEEITYT